MDNILEIKDLTKIYRKALRGKHIAVNSLNLIVKKGEVFGFLGPNGAGKSTVIKLLMNFIRPTAGDLFVNGLTVNSPKARQLVGYLPENPYFYDHLSASELLLFGGQATGMQRDLIRDRSDQLLERLKLSHVKGQRLRTYSKGMVQRIGLALAMIHDPDIYILDEPMSGLDPLGRRLVADLILEIHDNGKTVFFSSHILSDVEKLCDRIGILNRGRLLYSGATEDLHIGAHGLEERFIALIDKDERENYGTDLVVG